jgi:hypothetical protein
LVCNVGVPRTGSCKPPAASRCRTISAKGIGGFFVDKPLSITADPWRQGKAAVEVMQILEMEEATVKSVRIGKNDPRPFDGRRKFKRCCGRVEPR